MLALLMEYTVALSPILVGLVPLFFWSGCPCCGNFCLDVCSEGNSIDMQIEVPDEYVNVVNDIQNFNGTDPDDGNPNCCGSFVGTFIAQRVPTTSLFQPAIDSDFDEDDHCCRWMTLIQGTNPAGFVACVMQVTLHVRSGQTPKICIGFYAVHEDYVDLPSADFRLIALWAKEGGVECDGTEMTLDFVSSVDDLDENCGMCEGIGANLVRYGICPRGAFPSGPVPWPDQLTLKAIPE